MRKFTLHLMLGAASATFVMPARALAQAEPAAASKPAQDINTVTEDIIVTATRTGASRLQDTPLAVSAFGADQLAQTQSSNIRDLAQFTPSLNISLANTSTIITLRGVGTNNINNGSDPDVTMQVDGVYIARPSAMNNDFIDVERVEVLRGPQGTLYGRNAIGGTINVISRAPTDNLAAEGVLTVGNFGLVQTQAYVSGGIVPGMVQASLSGSYTRHGDYEKNIVPGAQSGVNNANHGGIRGQLRIEPATWIDATTRADYVFQDEDLPGLYHLQALYPPAALANSILGDYTKVAINSPSTTDYHGGGVSEDINVRLADNLTLKSISAIRWNDYSIFTDNDGTELNLIRGHFAEHERQISQEFNLNGKFGPLDAIAGAYYFDEKANTNVFAELYVPGVKINSLPYFKDRAKAVFGQGTLHVTPTFNLTAGLRYTTETKAIDSMVRRTFFLTTGALLPGFPLVIAATRKFDAFTPKFGMDWKVTPDILLYASATRGYKSGGTNYAATSLATAAFGPETIWSYEGGFKADLLAHHLRVNVTAFHYDYSNLQLQSQLVPGVVTILNAASAKVDGVEAEITAKLTHSFRIDANLSGLNARYVNFPSASVPAALVPFVAADPRYNAVSGNYNAAGHRLNQAPSISGTVAAQNDFALDSGGTITARADVYFQSRTFYEPTNATVLSQAPYALINAQLGYTSAGGAWSVKLWAKNIADKHYLFAFQAPGVEPAGIAAAPRTFGLRLSYRI